MSVQRSRSPFERLRQKFDDGDRRCRECGYVDADGGWRVTAAGSEVRYQRMCPTCDAVEVREMRL
ncbi:HVO_0649 family zinc finger protein [Natrononativus amylolyticus]|uniref:HVO_0649 family zinc finger protein n=1 Tax=Natrononativus amylolyticus TaxID=2963434 RepID=UPI0020CD18B8|nr:HVO_0649 family zinc finger protein [Natrononativus amylolyticus]